MKLRQQKTMEHPKAKSYPEARRFIDEVINREKGHKELAGKTFSQIVSYAKHKGYAIKDTHLVATLLQYYENKFPLPHWLEKNIGVWMNWR
jgi:hypothetical protein